MYGEIRFTVLGPVRAWREAGGERAGEAPTAVELDLGPPQQRAVLAILLTRAGQPVSLGEIVDVLWGADPPASAVNVVHRHVGLLRRLFEPSLPARAAGRWLLRGAGGYRLAVEASQVDLLRFRQLRGQARQSAAGGDPAQAVEGLLAALELWQGGAAAGIDPEVRGHPVFAGLDRERLAAAREAADLGLPAGLAPAVLPALQQVATSHPFDEPLQARLILCLAASGHQAEALRAYQASRERLASELGIDPGPELREAHARVLRQQVAAGRPAAPAARTDEPAHAPAPAIRPAQLPANLASFAGRSAELASLSGLLVPAGAGGPAPTRVVTIAGMAGVGKTALAVHWAHQVAGGYPDGQLYANLRGFDPSAPATNPGEVLRGFLDAFEVAPQRIPASPDAQAALYRSLLAGRRVLVLLDNARDAEQVRPLLPGSAGCLVIVTSRNELSGLVAAEGATPVVLESLSGPEAHELLARRLGADRPSAEPEPVAEIISRCAGLPLALAVVAARVAARASAGIATRASSGVASRASARLGTPAGQPLAAVARELRAVQAGLDAFAGADPSTDVRAVFSWSYESLDPAAARLFRLLGLHPGPDLSLPAAASLAGLPPGRARSLLAELRLSHLVIEQAPGRYTLHDLLRAYATELVGELEPEPERRAARHRMLDHYLHSAYGAARAVAPTREPMALAAPVAGVAPEPIGDAEAMDWFTTERPVLLAMVGYAATGGFERYAYQLPWTMHHFLQWQGHYLDWIAASLAGLAAAERLADRAAQAWLHRSLAGAYAHLDRREDATTELRRALALYEGLDDPEGQAQAHRALAFVHGRQEEYGDALHHSRQALDLFAGSGHRSGEANALNEVGWYWALRGDYDQAIDYCGRALALNRELGNRNGEAATWDSLGYAHHHRGDHQQAIACYQRAIALHQYNRDRYREAETFTHLAETHEAAGERDAARAAWEQAVAILSELDLPELARVRDRLARLAATDVASPAR